MNLNIPVSDQDEHKVPGDFDNLLGSASVSAMDSTNPNISSSKALVTGSNKSKLLLGLLGLFVILFVVIIVSISNSTNSLGEEITSTVVADTETGLAPNFFAASITNPTNESPPSLDGIDALFGAASEIEENNTTDDAPAVENEIPDSTTEKIDDEEIPEDNGNFDVDDFDVDDFDWGNTVNQGNDYNPQAELERLLGSSTTTTDYESYTTSDYDMGLNSNTMPETMMSGTVEGETGPGLLLLLVPNMLYGVSWLRKSRKEKM